MREVRQKERVWEVKRKPKKGEVGLACEVRLDRMDLDLEEQELSMSCMLMIEVRLGVVESLELMHEDRWGERKRRWKNEDQKEL